MTSADPAAGATSTASVRASAPRSGIPGVPPGLDRAAALSWRFLVVTVAVLAVLFLLVRLQTVVLPLLAALLLSTILVPPARWLRARGLPPLPATVLVFLAALAVVVGIGAIVVPAFASEAGDLGDTLDQAADDVRTWLVDDSPFDLTEQDVEDGEEALGDAIDELRSSGGGSGAVLEGATVAAEVFAGLLLTVFVTFFFVKDGGKIQGWFMAQVPDERRDLLRRLAGRGWWTLGGYVRGTAIFGLVEAAIFGLTLALLGADLIVPVMVITFLAPFLPIVGAVLSGVIAVGVALVTGGTGDAVIMAIVALVVQQLDNDVLNPLIYGRTVRLHPLVIVVALASGAALGGLVGAILAVPVAAVVVNVVGEYREAMDPPEDADAEPEPAPST